MGLTLGNTLRILKEAILRAIVFFLLCPVLAMAQPIAINPEQVIGFARVDLNKDSYDERFVLVLDNDGGVDLFIFHEATGAPTVFIDNFIETTRYPPAIYRLGDGGIEISLHASDAFGSHESSWLVDWDNSTYAIVGLRKITSPRMADELGSACGIDFLVGEVRTIKGDGPVVVREITVPPSPLLNPVPEASFELCVN